MLTGIYLLMVVALMLLAFTRHTIWVIAGFYFVYGSLKILAMDNLLDLGQLLLFRAVYVALFISVFVRLLKDREFIGRIYRGPFFCYVLLICVFLCSALYS